jgi:hypothetical protein
MSHKDLDARRRYAREWARAHYVPAVRRTVAERLWARVNKTDTCWLWTGSLGHGGRYGAMVVDGKAKATHRIAYELLVGPIPDGLEIDHLCRVHRCCNPFHLEPVTHRENLRRGIQATKTHCDRGHSEPLTKTAFGRLCRECVRENNRSYRRRLKERAA